MTESLKLKTNKKISKDVLTIGGAPFGGLYHSESKDIVDETIRFCIEEGIRNFDTAPLYGFGSAEEFLGDTLNSLEDVGDVHVTTKVGRIVISPEEAIEMHDHDDPSVEFDGTARSVYVVDRDAYCKFDYSKKGFENSFKDSLSRLGNFGVFGLRIHDAETEWRFSQLTGENNGVSYLLSLKESGKIHSISLGMNKPDYILKLLERFPYTFDAILMAGCWNLLDQSGYEVLLMCQQQNIKVENGGIFGAGLLWGGDYYKYSKATQEIRAKAKQWQDLCALYNVALPAVAMAFANRPEVVSSLVIGVSNKEEAQQNLEMLQQVELVPDELWNQARMIGLLPQHILI